MVATRQIVVAKPSQIHADRIVTATVHDVSSLRHTIPYRVHASHRAFATESQINVKACESRCDTHNVTDRFGKFLHASKGDIQLYVTVTDGAGLS